MAIETGNWMSEEPNDMRGRPLRVGDRVVRAYVSGRASNIEVVDVTRVDNGKVYLDGSPRAVNYPGRLLIVNEVYGIRP